MSSVFDALQLQRIAQAIEDGYAGGGTLTVDVTGAGDMQGATAGTAGVHGLVPAPQAGDQDKVLTGAGTWEDLPASGGVDYSTSEQDTGLKWIDGKNVYQQTVVSLNVASATVVLPLTIDTIINVEWMVYDADNNQWITSNIISNTYMVCVYYYNGGVYIEYRGTNNVNLYATIKYTKP